MTIHTEFANNAKHILEKDEQIIGLAVGGSWLSGQMDEFSDLDLIIVTREKITDNPKEMIAYARRLGRFLSGFTGEHVGEPRLLICLYDRPLLHVDIKFVTLDECYNRVETPVILFDRNQQLQSALLKSESVFPYPNYQWIEDRFWIWVHYALLKIGRGEYFEALDFMGFLRMSTLGPLLHVKNNSLPRGVRKVEMELVSQDLEDLKLTIAQYDRSALLQGLQNAVRLYRDLRLVLFDHTIILQVETELQVMRYFENINSRSD